MGICWLEPSLVVCHILRHVDIDLAFRHLMGQVSDIIDSQAIEKLDNAFDGYIFCEGHCFEQPVPIVETVLSPSTRCSTLLSILKLLCQMMHMIVKCRDCEKMPILAGARDRRGTSRLGCINGRAPF